MSEERRKVLEMLAAGIITTEEAEQLLNCLAPSAEEEDASEPEPADASANEASGGRPRAPRFLRVMVDSPERDNVNIRLPLGLIRTGLKLTTMLPGRVSRRLSERGIDFSHLGKLDDEDLIAELAALQVDVMAEDGEKVRIFCE